MSTPPTRLERLRRRLRRLADAFVVTHLPNVRYLVGFRGSLGVLVVTPHAAELFVPPLYKEQARGEASRPRIHVRPGEPLAAAAEWLRRRSPACVAYEQARLTVNQFELLRRTLRPKVEIVGLHGVVEALRAVKVPEEIARIRAALELTVRVFEQVLPLVRPGVRELDLAAEIEYRMKQHGARAPAFETIVASGPRSALPHGGASGKRLAKNEFVIFDLGAILSDYHSDMTRTVYLGTPSPRAKKAYRAVRDALEGARRAVRAGVKSSAVDAAARRLLTRRGYGRYFVHGTGHGLGLEVHEEPRVAPGVATPLESGNVITLEPGLYQPGWGGVRIEDVVVVRPQGAQTLTPLSTELICL